MGILGKISWTAVVRYANAERACDRLGGSADEIRVTPFIPLACG